MYWVGDAAELIASECAAREQEAADCLRDIANGGLKFTTKGCIAEAIRTSAIAAARTETAKLCKNAARLEYSWDSLALIPTRYGAATVTVNKLVIAETVHTRCEVEEECLAMIELTTSERGPRRWRVFEDAGNECNIVTVTGSLLVASMDVLARLGIRHELLADDDYAWTSVNTAAELMERIKPATTLTAGAPTLE